MIKTPFALLLALNSIAASQTKPSETDLYFADQSDRATFSSPNAWKSRMGASITLTPESSHAGLNLIFRAKPAGEYTAENDLVVGDKPFAIHSITLAPATTLLAQDPSRVTIQGSPLVLLPDAAGTAPLHHPGRARSAQGTRGVRHRDQSPGQRRTAPYG
jgi:hypothetical protein